MTSTGASSAFERVIGHAQRSPVGQASGGSKGAGSTASIASGVNSAEDESDEAAPASTQVPNLGESIPAAEPPRVGTPSTIASSASSALASRHEREALESSKLTSAPLGATTEGTTAASAAVDSKIEEGAGDNDVGQTSKTREGEKEKEPDPGPPALQDGALGLQQLLMGGTDVKKNEMDTLYSASKQAILSWRSKRKRYLKKVREHNAGHAIKLEARPVKDFVDELIWNTISKKKLHAHHRTKKGEDANHVQCAHYFAGTGEYKEHIARDALDPLKVLRGVKYEKGRSGATNEDRWFSYTHRRDKALEKIAEVQLNNKVFREAHASQLRTVLRPTDLRKLVDKAYRTGLHPGTGRYNAKWHQETRYSVENTESMIEDVIEYLDARAREGLWTCNWDATPAENSPKHEQVCQNFLKGKCKKGDK